MARIFMTGFESGDAVREMATSAAATTSSGTVRSGNYSLQINNAGWVERTLPSTYSEFYLRVALNGTDSTHNCMFLEFRKGTTVIGSVRHEADLTWSAYVGTTKTVNPALPPFQPNTWYLVEVYLKIADAGGVFQVKVDGNLIIDYSGDTKPGADTTIDRIRLVSGAGGTYFDDVAFNDTSGGADDSWPGEGKIIALTPNGAGASTEWTPSTGSNYQCVDDVPPNDDTDYVYESSGSSLDLYDLTACGLSDVTILRVWPEVQAKKTTADPASLKLVLRTNGTNYEDASAQELTTSYLQYKGDPQTTNPNTSSPWTTAELDALQAGVKGA